MKTQTIKAPEGAVISKVTQEDNTVVVEFEEVKIAHVPDSVTISEHIRKRAEAAAILWQLEEDLGLPEFYSTCYIFYAATEKGITKGTFYSRSPYPSFCSKEVAETVYAKYQKQVKAFFNDFTE